MFLLIMMVILLWCTLCEIGMINEKGIPYKDKKINVKKIRKIIYIPYCALFFTNIIDKPYFDGTVYKRTFVLTIINYIFAIVAIIFAVIYFNNSKLFETIFYFFQLFWGLFLGIYYDALKSRYEKWEKTGGMNFK